MADQAEVYVKNVKYDSIRVIREQPDGTPDYDTTLASGTVETIPLQSSQVKLIINAPDGVDMGQIPFVVISTGGVKLSCSTDNRKWTIKTEDSDSNPDVPTTVNVNVGDEDV